VYAPYVIRLFGKKNTYIIAMAWGSAFYFVLRLFGELSVIHFTVIICLGNMIFGTAGPMGRQCIWMQQNMDFIRPEKMPAHLLCPCLLCPLK
jgi:hypothetical protein